MHELSITHEIVSVITEKAAGARVTRVVLEIGKVSGILAEAVRFCFEVCARDTIATGAELIILEPEGKGRCRNCGAEVTLKEPYGICECGSSDLALIAGHELRIKELEVLECAPPADAPATPSHV